MESWIVPIITSVVATALWFGGATMLTWIKNKWPKYGDLALYWLASAACLGVLIFATTGYIPFAKPKPPEVTPDNIESNIKAWSETVGLPFSKGNLPDSYFSLLVTTRTGTPIIVSRLIKEKPSYLQFASNLTFSPEHQAVLATLTKDQVETVTEEIALELAKTRVGATITTIPMPQTGANVTGQTVVVLQKAAPISAFNETKFVECVDDIEFAVALVRATVNLALSRATASRAIAKPAGVH